MTATTIPTREELQELCERLLAELSATSYERNQLRAWADRMPALPASGVLRVGEIQAVEDWMRRRPGDSDADSLRMHA